MLTGGLIMVGGGENAVAQVFLGILVCALWLCLVLHRKPYASTWDNALSAVLSFILLVTLVSGVCLRLFDLTAGDADEYQKEAFGVVLVVSIVICLVLSVASIVLSTECLRDRAATLCASKKKQQQGAPSNGGGGGGGNSKVAPTSTVARQAAAQQAWSTNA